MDRAFECRDVVFEVFALARKLALRACDRRVRALDERAHRLLHVLRFCRAGDCAWHGEQRGVPARNTFLVRDAYLELDARVLVEVVQAREHRLQSGGREGGGGGGRKEFE
jgi:hypothetical protein